MTAMDNLAFSISKAMDFSVVTDLLKTGDSPLSESEVGVMIDDIFQIANKELADGASIDDLFAIMGKSSERIFWLAKNIGANGSGKQKKAFAVAAIVALYKFIDRGPDGKQNRINLPWIPNGIEKTIEDKVCPIVAGLVIEAIYKMYDYWNDDSEITTPAATDPVGPELS